ncbi:hypothetical protein FSARC_7581 [Fusarium sarcochroum]|uniref:Uncharacterized protein n=1 Tax=Fusarium sarcochroum TaxID=1208366 RepID=A0A8H4X863_9HYPO|nr:hypothetical protein FSARC_7581 [Fusarium sarcochroum]
MNRPTVPSMLRSLRIFPSHQSLDFLCKALSPAFIWFERRPHQRPHSYARNAASSAYVKLVPAVSLPPRPPFLSLNLKAPVITLYLARAVIDSPCPSQAPVFDEFTTPRQSGRSLGKRLHQNAMVYQGARTGIQAAVDQVGLLRGAHEGPFNSGHRKAELQLRLIDFTGHPGNEVYRDLAVSPDEIAAIMIPRHSIFSMNPMPSNVIQTPMRFVIATVPSEAAPQKDPTFVPHHNRPSIVVELRDRYGLEVNKALISQHLEEVNIVIPRYSTLNYDILLRTTIAQSLGSTESSQLSQMFHCLGVMCRGLTTTPIDDDSKLKEICSLVVRNGAVEKLQGFIQSKPDDRWCLEFPLTTGHFDPPLGPKGCPHYPRCNIVKVVVRDGVKGLEFLM